MLFCQHKDIKQMEFIGLLCLIFLASLPLRWAQGTNFTSIVVNGSANVAETDSDFICATLDWWPPEKCNNDDCPWGQASVLNLNTSSPLLANAIKAFELLRIRIGGSLQDQVVYDVGDFKPSCPQFRKMQGGMFGFSGGCLHMDRWDELNNLFRRTGAAVTFSLNALRGRSKGKGITWEGAWDPTNAQDFIEYTVSKGHDIDSWEFGNELSGSGVGARVDAKQYGKDLIKLKAIISELYNRSLQKPSLIAPGGLYDKPWFTELLQVSGPNVVNLVTHHIYNLGPGSDPNLPSRILNPHVLDNTLGTFRDLKQTIKSYGPWASAWVGEAGGAYNSGSPRVSNTFLFSFWFLDQLGMASKYDTKVYCRQSLVGGNYGLLDTNTLVPNPDYYSALLWRRLMGKVVLDVHGNSTPYLRYYAHCSKRRANGRAGVTLLFINLSNGTDFRVGVQNGTNTRLHAETASDNEKSSPVNGSFSRVRRKGSDQRHHYRKEYHLTPKDGNLLSRTMLLNGIPLVLTSDQNIPTLHPVCQNVNSPITVAALSIVFAVLPDFDAPACA